MNYVVLQLIPCALFWTVFENKKQTRPPIHRTEYYGIITVITTSPTADQNIYFIPIKKQHSVRFHHRAIRPVFHEGGLWDSQLFALSRHTSSRKLASTPEQRSKSENKHCLRITHHVHYPHRRAGDDIPMCIRGFILFNRTKTSARLSEQTSRGTFAAAN